MSKAEERALEKYPLMADDDKEGLEALKYIGMECDCASEFNEVQKAKQAYFIKGYHQAEKDLLTNKHEKSWRLDEKLWKGIKDVEEASYQYTYDASNDWAYDIPTWDDVQDAFKAGSEWKEGFELAWEDMMIIHKCIKDAMNYHLYKMIEGMEGQRVVYQEVLKRFKAQKGK